MAIRAGRNSRRIAVTAAVPVLAAAVTFTGSSPASASAEPHWNIMKMIAVPNTRLYDVAALPGGTAWAGGQAPNGQESVYNLTGGQWHAVPVPALPGTYADVSATSPANVWFANNNDQVGQRTGNSWTITSFGPNTECGGVVTTGPDNTWAFTHNNITGQNLAHHYNGMSWQVIPLPAAAGGFGLSGASSASSGSNIWTWAWSNAGHLTMHYNGTTWQTVSLPANVLAALPNLSPQQMLAESPSNVWATASSVQNINVPGPVVLLHWNGHTWGKITGQLPAGSLTGAIASDGHAGLWVSAVTPGHQPFLVHYNGGAWTSYPMPVQTVGVMSITSLALIPGTPLVLGVSNLAYQFGTTNGAAFLRIGP